MTKKLTIILLTLLIGGTLSAQKTEKLTANKTSEYGLVYTLPQTGFKVVLAAKRTDRRPGPLAQYAKRYLRLDPILKQSTEWELIGGEVLPTAQADPEERYLVQFKSGSAPFMMLTAEGFPFSVNDDAYEPEAAPQPTLKAVPAGQSILDTPAVMQVMTGEMMQSTSSAKRAELAAARLYEIRQTRTDIISGQADNMPTDGEAMRLALATLDEQEAALTALFMGSVTEAVEVATFDVLPPTDDESETIVVARLSAVEGLIPAENLAGEPIRLKFDDRVMAEMPKNEKGVTKTFPKGGLAYRIPGSAELTLTYRGKTLVRERYDITQYGVVFGLEPNLFTDRKAPAYLHMSPLTGGVAELGTITE